MHYIYQQLPQGHIRLLTLHPGDASAELSCTLQSTPLESAPEYEAVSYAWGSEGFTDSLAVSSSPERTTDEGVVSITPNVTCLLRSLRRAAEPRVLWIDAICINQTDTPERSVQVQQMRNIYTRALRTVIWLGPAAEDGGSDLALAFLKKMAIYKKNLERGHWINGERVASDTTSETGSARPWVGSAPSEASSDDKEDEDDAGENDADSSDDQSARGASIVGDDAEPLAGFSRASSLFDRDADAEAGRAERSGLCMSKFTILRDFIRGRVDEMRWKASGNYQYYITLGYWNPLTRRRRKQRWESGMAAWQDNFNVSHVAFGIPVLYENDMYPFFHERYHSRWAAVDELLDRPWWSRTWVVQEVWSASSRAVLQCGQRTIKWKTFQKAMSYEEAWDDMGGLMKERDDPRFASWGRLKRRYGLANHLCKMRLIDGRLSDLLWNTWDRDAQDPRDKVFAVLGLVSRGEGHRLLRPDYGKSTRRVFCEAARDIVRAEESLDILLAAGGGPRAPCDGGSLPSWVPDWRREANAARPVLFVNRARLLTLYMTGSMTQVVVNGHGYSACGGEKAAAWFGGDLATLHVHAVLVDEVGPVGAPQGPGPVEAGAVVDAACSVAGAALAGKPSAFRSSSLWWSPWRKGEEQKEDTLTDVVERALCAGGPGEKTKREVIENVAPLRRFFVTKHERRACVGPASARPGDKVFVIAGCNFPIVLREGAPGPNGETGMFELVGEAYVDGIMTGEAIAKMKAPAWWERLAWWLPLKEVRWSEVAIY
ncbi:hypothetical protein LX32DRAFT_680988 [Colletotrichum zoysiae]|uniref:Heterokaryon incompatibility domain-containing protein n=1 Tax=Colletotrichum zoysiae TaxID=1216348 RepID=A0AAD9HPQ6_9PEZI|nr:hypothetical protein LX32DRAFT_680988 [Colletotrichum zoysiae]